MLDTELKVTFSDIYLYAFGMPAESNPGRSVCRLDLGPLVDIKPYVRLTSPSIHFYSLELGLPARLQTKERRLVDERSDGWVCRFVDLCFLVPYHMGESTLIGTRLRTRRDDLLYYPGRSLRGYLVSLPLSIRGNP